MRGIQEIQDLLAPVLIGLVSWWLKEVVTGLYRERSEWIRSELRYQLKEIWCPIYYWFGVVALGQNEECESSEGVKQLESVMARSAYVIPKEQYYSIVRLIEVAKGLRKQPPPVEEVLRTRRFIYRQIEATNYLLYRRHVAVDIRKFGDPFLQYQVVLRVTSTVALHATIWIAFALTLYAVYLSVSEGHVVLPGLLFVLIGVLAVVDLIRRVRIAKELARMREGGA